MATAERARMESRQAWLECRVDQGMFSDEVAGRCHVSGGRTAQKVGVRIERRGEGDAWSARESAGQVDSTIE